MRALPQFSKSQGKERNYVDAMDEKIFNMTTKGKGKAKEETPTSPPPEERLRVKKPKRAETRPCPVCGEAIPLRLMNRHAQLETERVEEIIKQIGSSEPLYLPDEFDDLSRPGSSTNVRSRRSAIKALKSFTSSPMSSMTGEHINKTIQTILRHRKQRYARFKEMAREEEEGYSERSRWMRSGGTSNDEIVCPVCSRGIRGDQDVINAHVDVCLTSESRGLEEERARNSVEIHEGSSDSRYNSVLPVGAVGHVGNVRGTGIHTRDPRSRDVDDEVDIDGDETNVYGEAQFTEGDILPVNENDSQEFSEEVDVDIEGNHSENVESVPKSLRDLIADGKLLRHQMSQDRKPENNSEVKAQFDEVESIDVEILNAKESRDNAALVTALESKIKQLEALRSSTSTSLLCRICLDSYTEPTVSTGCWHTCCRECWLRCLGSTKLCPICKRITDASDLRRVYL